MFGEQPTAQYGRVILFTGPQRGGELGGPVCRFMLDARTGVLMDLGRIDCFAVEPHHHTQTPKMNPGIDSPVQKVRVLAKKDADLDLAAWQECAHKCVAWLRDEWVGELREAGWGDWVIREVEMEHPALVLAVEEFLLAHPPSAIAGSRS